MTQTQAQSENSANSAVIPVMPAAVMVASGNAAFRKHMLAALAAGAWEAIEALGGADALCKLELAPCARLVLDRQLPDLDPEELRAMVVRQYPEVTVEIHDGTPMAAVREPEPAAPPAPLQLAPLPLVRREPAPVPARLPDPVKPAPAAKLDLLPGLVGASQHLQDLSGLVRLVAPRRTTVLLLGETGTGKELVAQALHQASDRAHKPFVVLNCAAIPEALLESELFGHTRGAFTGAVQARGGRLLAAHTGTIFLDEIGELPLGLQSKLLRFLQEGELQRLGSNDAQKVNVRVIAATNVDLLARVEAGTFRRDLYHRLAVFPIELQALRQRTADIVPLARHFLRTTQDAGPRVEMNVAALEMLERYPWPGNVRELQHAIERAYILATGAAAIAPEHFPVASAWQRERGFGPGRETSITAEACHELV